MDQDFATVTQVSRALGLSTRMLRYYEELGLVQSRRREGYAYRLYDQEALRRLRQIIILRKLRLPLRDIQRILEDPSSQAAIQVFQQKIAGLDVEREALKTVRIILSELLQALKGNYWLPAEKVLLDDTQLSGLMGMAGLAVDLTPLDLQNRQKERKTMDDLNRAEQNQSKLTNVRIVHLPASTVAAAHFIGPDPEDHSGQMIADFARANRLWETSSSVRLYGFNHPNPPPEGGEYGYEFWVTIPDDMEVPAPLEKKHFPGGTYAAHCIQMGNFHEWDWLFRWAYESKEWEINGSGTPEDMFGCLEEHLNYYDHIRDTVEGEPETMQLDLLIPVQPKKKS